VSATAWSVAHGAGPSDASRTTTLRSSCGRTFALSSGRWWQQTVDGESRILQLSLAPAIDLGCGPGRHTVALARRGIPSLGIDSAPAAVAAARARGAIVLQRSVFDRLPDEGRWGSALLLDGNVGIGGDPARLLGRVRQLLRRGGRALIELEGPGEPTETLHVRAELHGAPTEWFPWARVGIDGLERLAATTGFRVVTTWSDHARWFARLDPS
jgi:SAM-dependent methyltransferase